MLKNNTYKQALNQNDKHLKDRVMVILGCIDSNIRSNYYTKIVEEKPESEYREFSNVALNSYMFDLLIEKSESNNEDHEKLVKKFKKCIFFIQTNVHSYIPENYGNTKFNNLVDEDCYKNITEIIGTTPDEYLNSIST